MVHLRPYIGADTTPPIDGPSWCYYYTSNTWVQASADYMIGAVVERISSSNAWISASFLAVLPVSGASSSGPHGDQSMTSTSFAPSAETVSVYAGAFWQYLMLLVATSQLWSGNPSVGASMAICRDGGRISGDLFTLGGSLAHRNLVAAVVCPTVFLGMATSAEPTTCPLLRIREHAEVVGRLEFKLAEKRP
jgi:hypothetical protein